jgi:hypothetical protein
MSQLFIDFQCNLSPLFRDVIGSRGFAFVVQDGFLGLGQLTLYSHFCPLLLTFKYSYPQKPLRMEIHSKGTQNVAGNLYGIEANLLNVELSTREPTLRNLGYHFNVEGDYGAVHRIVAMGEVRVETIETGPRSEEIACFFPPNSVLPDVIHINKKTLDIIGFHFENGKWVYIFAEGEGHFRVLLDHSETPEEMIVSDEFIAAGLNLNILDDIR